MRFLGFPTTANATVSAVRRARPPSHHRSIERVPGRRASGRHATAINGGDSSGAGKVAG
jgi:hypothetical protein